MKLKLLKKVVATGLILGVCTAHIGFADSQYYGQYDNSYEVVSDLLEKKSTVHIDYESMNTWDGLTKDQVADQLNKALLIVDKERKIEFKNDWDQKTAQEKHDYLLPLFYHELTMLQAQLYMMEKEIKPDVFLKSDFFDSFKVQINSFIEKEKVFSNIGEYQYGCAMDVKPAANDILKMVNVLENLIEAYNGVGVNQEEVNKLFNTYGIYDEELNKYMNDLYNYSLLRENNIAISGAKNELVADSVKGHIPNIKNFKNELESIKNLKENMLSGKKMDSQLWDAVSEAEKSSVVIETGLDDPLFLGVEHAELTPLAKDASSKIRNAAELTKMLSAYKNSDKRSKKIEEVDDAIEAAERSVNKFTTRCNALASSVSDFGKDIPALVENIENERQEIAVKNGCDDWFSYKLSLEKKAENEKALAVVEKANELAQAQKEYEERMAKLKAEEYEKWLDERIDFSKNLSQQNHNKQFYMEKVKSQMESNSFYSDKLISTWLVLESDAFDKLFSIRANGGDIKLLQELYDDNPNEFYVIYTTYISYH